MVLQNRYTFLLLLIFFLASCKLSKDVKVPEDATPAAFRGGQANDSGSVADLPWKSFFQDAALKKLIDTALVRNYDLQIAIRNMEVAQQTLRQARVNWLPAFNLNTGVSTTVPSKNSLNGSLTSQFLGTNHIEDFTANVSMAWEVDVWGKIRNQKKAALAAYLQSTEVGNTVRTTLVSAVSQGFYNLLMLDAQLAIAQRNLALRDSTLAMIRLQHDAGVVTSLAVSQAEALQLSAAALIPQLEQNITLQENALSILAGTLPGKIERGSMDAVVLREGLQSGVPAAMLGRRPDVRGAELALAVANARVGVAKAGFYPSLNITATGGLNTFKAHNWFTVPASLFGVAAGNLTTPLFQHRQVRTQFEIAKKEREKTVLQFRQTVLNAVGEVSGALVKVEKLGAQQEIVEKRTATLKQATKDADLLFKSGLANYLEVITAQGNALQSELELVALKRDQLAAGVELYRALGGGWK